MNDSQLDARLRAANPLPVDYVPSIPRVSAFSRVGKVVLAVLAAMSIGAGAGWAASGTNPFTSLFSDTATVSESGVGLNAISSLEPMTQKTLDTLPPTIAQTAVIRAAGETVRDGRTAGQPTARNRRAGLDLEPTPISAIARLETNLGTPTILLVIADQVCSFTGTAENEVSNCFPLVDVAEGNALTWRSEEADARLNRLSGLFNDQVAAIDIQGDSSPPVEIPDNLLELRNVGAGPITLVGLDARGKELFRNRIAPTTGR